jgi:hypothetical protein
MVDSDLIDSFIKDYEARKQRINNFSEHFQKIKFEEKHAQTKHTKEKTKEISQIFSFGKPVYVTSENNQNFRTFTSKKDLQDFIEK